MEALAQPEVDLHDLIERGVQADPDAFVALYSRYFDRVYSYVRVALANEHDAQDAAQTVFMRMYEALPRYRQHGQPFEAWLLRIARNHVIDHMRKNNRIEVSDPSDVEHRHESLLAKRSDALVRPPAWIDEEELLGLVEQLSQEQRQTLVLRFMLDLSVEETAHVMDRSPEAVRALQFRALRFLKARFRRGQHTVLEPIPVADTAGSRRRALRMACGIRNRRRPSAYSVALGRF